jgi:hypothetical protein
MNHKRTIGLMVIFVVSVQFAVIATQDYWITRYYKQAGDAVAEVEKWRAVADRWEVDAKAAQRLAARWEQDYDDLQAIDSKKVSGATPGRTLPINPDCGGYGCAMGGAGTAIFDPPVTSGTGAGTESGGAINIITGLNTQLTNIRLSYTQLCGPTECVDIDAVIKWLRSQSTGKTGA